MTTKAPTKRVLKIPALEQANRRVWEEVTPLRRVTSGKFSEKFRTLQPLPHPRQIRDNQTMTPKNIPTPPIGYVNRYRGNDGKIWSGRTIFSSVQEARECPCANKDSYIDTCAIRPEPK